MGDKTGIQWTDATWNPTTGCDRVSPGCDNCYALGQAKRLKAMGQAKYQTDGDPRTSGPGFGIAVHPDTLDQPLRWAKPRKIFVNSMSDLFHAGVPDEFIAKVFAVMAATPRHTYQILTKRHGRMRSLLNSADFVARVRRQMDVIEVDRQIAAMGDEVIVAIAGYRGYYVSDRGRVFTGNGSDRCLWREELLPTTAEARRLYCSAKCRQKANYEQKVSRWEPPADAMRQMSPDVAEQGHQRVTLYLDGEPRRELVHRLVLSAFDRAPEPGEQGCHVNGDPSVNALPNLRWGTQEDNWDDRKRHGNGRSYFKVSAEQVREIRQLAASGESACGIGARFGISDTQVRNIVSRRQWSYAPDLQWPLPGVWLGVSVEDQQRADLRIPALLKTPAAVRFLSCEPLLGPIDLHAHDDGLHHWLPDFGPIYDPPDQAMCQAHGCPDCPRVQPHAGCAYIDWVIVGGESGRDARPMHPDWARSLRDQCAEAGVPFFFKQWGEWIPDAPGRPTASATRPGLTWRWPRECLRPDGTRSSPGGEGGTQLIRVGKHAAGRELDGRTWDEFPASAAAVA
jgi:protein gp37